MPKEFLFRGNLYRFTMSAHLFFEPVRRHRAVFPESNEVLMRSIWKWIKRLFSEKTAAKNTALLIISVMITVSLSTPVNKFIDSSSKNKTQTVSITFLEREDSENTETVCIADNYEKAPHDVFYNIRSALSNAKIEFEKTKNDSGINMLLIDAAANAGKTVSFDCPAFSNTSFNLIALPSGGIIRVDCGSFSRVYDLNSDSAVLMRCMPICGSFKGLIPYFAVYITAFFLIVLSVYVSEKYILQKFCAYVMTHRTGKWIKYNMPLDVIVIFITLCVFSLISYHTGAIPRFLDGGDQNDYWYRISDIGNFEEFKSIYDFRGYLCYWGPAFCRYAASFFGGLDPVDIWIISMSLLTAGLLGITFPMLAKKLYGYSLTRPQVYLSVLITCILWRTLLAYVLMDLPAAVFFISAFTIYIYFLENPSIAKGVFCGAFFAIASNLKVNYQYVSIALVIVWTVFFFVKKAKRIKRLSNPKAKKRILNKLFNAKSISSAAVIVLAFFAVCIPQLVINTSKGVVSLTPYETESSYAVLSSEDDNYLVVELGASRTFTYTRLYPSGSPADRQVQGIMIDYTGNTSSLLKYPQLFEMFLRKPIDTLIMMGKKMILGMNVLDSSPYNAEYTGYSNSLVWLRCLLNYTVLFGGIYAVFRKRGNIKDKLIFFCMFLLCILPNTLSQVEWRYFIVGYLFAAFHFCYSFLPYYTVRSNEEAECYSLNVFYKGLAVFLPAMAIVCATIT